MQEQEMELEENAAKDCRSPLLTGVLKFHETITVEHRFILSPKS